MAILKPNNFNMKKINYFMILALSVISVVFNACKKEEDETPTPDDTTITITEHITSSTTWLASKTYIINGEIYVDGCTLTIEPGTTIKFGTWGSLNFGYDGNTTLVANGTADKPITFTSSATSPVAGAWDGLYFWQYTLQNSSMTHCLIDYAGTNSRGAVCLIGCKITFNNCTIKNAKTTGINCDYGTADFMSFNNNSISNCGTHAIEIYTHSIQNIGTGNTITCSSGYGIAVKDGSYNSTTSNTWKKQTVPYFINSTITIDGNLTIEAGSTFKFAAGTAMEIGYTSNTYFSAIGTTTEPITFTTSATSPAPGGWNGIIFYAYTQSNSKMDYCNVTYGGFNGNTNNANISLNDVNNMTISNCNISYSQAWGIYKNNSNFIDTGNTFSNNALGNINP
ncbi:MAG: hypothetical protein A2275_11320 [Bacteroidetes bacterium RIFOXYA12_FULL_35_11]|nr:MAG: hypothetical protein A2X01_19265 [Bacteroidetes bacterium GWF2_35_48]OFY74429.1 MAG: hypothetical protein A2275_11320 [Bacteroidetes bacterium RIFOXYA12_FULL_35_11]OFY92849.1 MAG: hypothetical protein A2491_04355 [Bacteroidetes bacterium RIFOXYC12_FULL_35_7]